LNGADWVKKIQVVAISEFMQEKLMRMPKGQIGSVISVHADLFNVQLDDGELLTIQTDRHIRTPMTLELPENSVLPVAAATPVYRLNSPVRLNCGELELEFGNAVLFSSQVLVQHPDDFILAESLLNRHLSGRLARASVFGYLVSEAGPGCDDGTADTVDRAYGDILRASSSRLLQAMLHGDAAAAIQAARSFIGLGPGMTPAGDDFLQGFLLFAETSPAFHPIAGSVIEQLRTSQPLDTTLVSRALWRHFLSGRVSSAAVELVEAYNRADWAAFSVQIRRISEIGHSSGDDFLSGIWFALERLATKPLTTKPLPDNAGGERLC
jgi:hypothetical protein